MIRQKLGFDYFYVGRDHAGAENLYKYDAATKIVQKLKKKFKIKSFISKGGFYCGNCNKYVIKGMCAHKKLKNISGTEFREYITKKNYINTQTKKCKKFYLNYKNYDKNFIHNWTYFIWR